VPQTLNIIFADNSVTQLRDEVFDKPAELEEHRETSEDFQDMYDQVVSSIKRFINKIKSKLKKPPPRNSNLPVMPLPSF
jgi:predicted house-cleaning NTP pyrophosphatase (Maf/HAM1 superfamily)